MLFTFFWKLAFFVPICLDIGDPPIPLGSRSVGLQLCLQFHEPHYTGFCLRMWPEQKNLVGDITCENNILWLLFFVLLIYIYVICSSCTVTYCYGSFDMYRCTLYHYMISISKRVSWWFTLWKKGILNKTQWIWMQYEFDHQPIQYCIRLIDLDRSRHPIGTMEVPCRPEL